MPSSILKNFKTPQNISIKKKVRFAFLLIMLIMALSSLGGVYSLSLASNNFVKFRKLNEKVIAIVETSGLVTELQRNVSIYTHSGLDSTKQHIDEVMVDLKKSTDRIKTMLFSQEEQNLIKKIDSHLKVYDENFQTAVEQRKKKVQLFEIKMKGLLYEIDTDDKNLDIVKIESSILKYFEQPSRKLFQQTMELISIAKNKSPGQQAQKLTKLEEAFSQASQAQRSYLYLVNVVMAGEAAEFRYNSEKIKSLILNQVQFIEAQVDIENRKARYLTIILLILAAFFGLTFAWKISTSISTPIENITQTFQALTEGETAIEIPEQNRKDEIGTMSKAAEVFREKSVRLESSNNELSQFAYRTSHDLKAPLVSIIGLNSIIKSQIKKGNKEEALKNVDKVSKSATTLNSLIADILNLSRADWIEDSKETISLKHAVKDIEEKFEAMTQANSIEFVYDISENLQVYTEPVRLKQVVENLISNAIKYFDPEKSQHLVTVKAKAEPHQVTIQVEDNGLGIPQKHHSEVFGMFKRFHSEAAFGSGLGLYLVKKHVEKMNGKISLASQKGKGTCFKITLPQ